MTLTKQNTTDKIETVLVNNFYVLQCRDRLSVLEGDTELSASFHRYTLSPDADVSTISDPVVLAQFNAVMTDEVKANYQTFLASQQPVTEKSSE